MNQKYQYLFGPVPSRRFVWSLGVDLLPAKTCTLDCIFCQLGRTNQKTIKRQSYVPLDPVFAEIDDWLQADGAADYITLSGSGEPTLHSEFGRVLEFLKDKPIPSVLLTNGTLLSDPAVREAAARAEVVKVSLSAWDDPSFQWVNRPSPELSFEQVIEGQKRFREMFQGNLWMEVFFILGVNAMPEKAERIAAHVNAIGPDRVHLNTVARPPAEEFAAPLTEEKLNELAGLFEPAGEVIADLGPSVTKDLAVDLDAILAMLRRRPCTMAQLGKLFGMHTNEVAKYLGQLLNEKKIETRHTGGDVYYSAVQ